MNRRGQYIAGSTSCRARPGTNAGLAVEGSQIGVGRRKTVSRNGTSSEVRSSTGSIASFASFSPFSAALLKIADGHGQPTPVADESPAYVPSAFAGASPGGGRGGSGADRHGRKTTRNERACPSVQSVVSRRSGQQRRIDGVGVSAVTPRSRRPRPGGTTQGYSTLSEPGALAARPRR